MFVDDRLAFKMRGGIVNIRAAVTFDEKGRIRFERNMLNVDMMSAMLSKTLQERVRLLCGGERLNLRTREPGRPKSRLFRRLRTLLPGRARKGGGQ